MGANHIGHIEVGVMAGLIGAGATMVFGGAASILVVSAIWFCLPEFGNMIRMGWNLNGKLLML